MKLEKRSMGAADAAPAQPDAGGEQKKKPVIVYIMILFIVAFLLMALSFVMHQRSNEEVIGTLQSSVSTLQELQTAKDENVALQKKLDETSAALTKAQADLNRAGDAQQTKVEALSFLYTLQMQYLAEQYADCKTTIQKFEDSGYASALPSDPVNDTIVSPAQRYQQLKEAVMSH